MRLRKIVSVAILVLAALLGVSQRASASALSVPVSTSEAFAVFDAAVAEPAAAVATTECSVLDEEEEACWREGLRVVGKLGIVVAAELAMIEAAALLQPELVVLAGIIYLDACFDLADAQDALVDCLNGEEQPEN